MFLLSPHGPVVYRRGLQRDFPSWGRREGERLSREDAAASSLSGRTGNLPRGVCICVFVWFWLIFCFPGFYLNRSLDAFKLYFVGECLPPFSHTRICHTKPPARRNFGFLCLYSFPTCSKPLFFFSLSLPCCSISLPFHSSLFCHAYFECNQYRTTQLNRSPSQWEQ